MTENVILLGAGASHSAGIPLLSEFMRTIRRLATTGVSEHRELTADEIKALQKAVAIRDSLREYHATVAFDQFSIEDILSILSFDVLAGSNKARQQLDEFAQAISLTIELTCSVQHHGKLDSMCDTGPDEYRAFWRGLFNALRRDMHEMPAIISFNYDLVLERALLQTMIGHPLHDHRKTIRGRQLAIRYDHKNCDSLDLKVNTGNFGGYGSNQKQGLYLELLPPKEADAAKRIEIPIIKPHGSLNFPKSPRGNDWSLVKAVSDPAILPPVFNKASVEIGAPIWRAGMEALRGCKNLIICGYSLPITDTYMQYFLKSALGPNADLDQIFVFDPALFESGPAGPALRDRYSKCFSAQFEKQIQFNPDTTGIKSRHGSFAHFTELLEKRPESLLFGISPEQQGDPSSSSFRPIPRRRTGRTFGL
ncbi:MAG: hypothetical protein JNN17_06210 [Verrucomicrobiaceae bacterium]|nr:hypothetical protein [Verrucomicrobiaceae bacterium]